MNIQSLYDLYLKHPVISNDTRKITEGCIYWGIKGERFDGNSFAEEALAKGAAYAVIDNPGYNTDSKCILVEASVETLQQLSNYHRKQLDIPIIAIAGSNGKTTTKELMQRVLSKKYKAFATPGNLNNHIGLPLSLLKLNNTHDIAVIELGANHQGENAMLAEICEPTHGIITNIGKDHLEGFGGMAGVEIAQLELFKYLEKSGGTAIVNMDDDRIARKLPNCEIIAYSADNILAEVQGKIAERFPVLRVKVSYGNASFECGTHLFGSFHLYNVLAATAAGVLFEVPLDEIKAAVESYIPDNMRSQVIKLGTNTVILDAYNANPSSMHASVRDFGDYPVENKVLILGDMFEMGEESTKEHRELLEAIPYDEFKAVALAGKDFYAFNAKYPAKFFQTTDELKIWFDEQGFSNSYIYLKGSRGMQMERLISYTH